MKLSEIKDKNDKVVKPAKDVPKKVVDLFNKMVAASTGPTLNNKQQKIYKEIEKAGYWVSNVGGKIQLNKAGYDTKGKKIDKKAVGIKYESETLEEGISKNVLRSYLETALWSDGDDLDDADIKKISKETLNQAKKDLNKFWKQAGKLLDGEDENQVAHDFWLTRNGHGAGFWDGDYEEEKGKKLTKIAEKFGQINPITGDDGKIYFE